MVKRFVTVKYLKLYTKPINLQFFDIYLMWTLSSSAYSNNFKLIKTSKPIKSGLLRNPGLTFKNPKPNKSQ